MQTIDLGATCSHGAPKINNLGGLGPMDGERKIVFESVATVDNEPVNLVVRALSAKEIQGLAASALHYQENAAQFRDQLEEQVNL